MVKKADGTEHEPVEMTKSAKRRGRIHDARVKADAPKKKPRKNTAHYDQSAASKRRAENQARKHTGLRPNKARKS